MNDEETIGLKNYRGMIHLGKVKYQRMGGNRNETRSIQSVQFCRNRVWKGFNTFVSGVR